MSEDQAKNVLTTIEDSEISEWVKSLDPASQQELRRQAIQQAAVNKAAKEPEKIDWGRLSDAELRDLTMKKFGF